MTEESSHNRSGADELAAALQRAGEWCGEYLELQHSADLGRPFAELLETFAEIARLDHSPGGTRGGGVDRFERLKRLEQRIDEQLAALAESHRESLQRRADCTPTEHAPQFPTQRLFVYGTLKRGHCRAFALAGQQFLGVARTGARYRLFDCGDYPVLVSDPQGVSVEGELWEVDGDCLRKLDRIEGVAQRLYERRPIELQPPHDVEPAASYFSLRSVRGLRDCGERWP